LHHERFIRKKHRQHGTQILHGDTGLLLTETSLQDVATSPMPQVYHMTLLCDTHAA